MSCPTNGRVEPYDQLFCVQRDVAFTASLKHGSCYLKKFHRLTKNKHVLNVHLTYFIDEAVEYMYAHDCRVLTAGSSKGIWKNPEVNSAMAKRAGRRLPIRSIISFMLGICQPSFELTLLRLQESTVNRHPFVGLRTRCTCDHAIARDG